MSKEVRKIEEKIETTIEEKIYLASQWQLMWWKFKRHKLAVVALWVLGMLYFIAIFCEFLAPYDPNKFFKEYPNTPPTRIHFFDNGKIVRPFVYGISLRLNLDTFRREVVLDKGEKYPIKFFCRGDVYRFWGIFETNVHLFGVEEGVIFLFGTDNTGRDIFSRVLYGTRISLTIGLVGIFLSLILGITLGGLAGYLGGVVDEFIMRTVDILASIPTIPLWMALSAAVPREWPVVKTYFTITIILSVVGWTGLARVVRGKFLSLKDEDFIIAARITGCSQFRIIFRHLFPSFLSYIIVSVSLSIPNMILGETALSFLGLGMQPPAISWGVLLQQAQDLNAMRNYPWILIPCIFVFVSVLMFNFLGDGLRDAADPYAR